jgi:L-iditol 2-dehydrogenase
MLAAVYHGPNDLRVEETALPTIGPGEVLLKVQDASICGTDLRIVHGGHRKYPQGTVRIPGHEVVGEVAACGSGVSGLTEGQRIFVAPNSGCGHCRECISGNNNLCANYQAIGVTIDGAFAEYVRIPEAFVRQGNLMPISAGVDPAAAALIEPLACVLRGQNALHIQPGEVVLILGAGPIGLMHARLARLRGAGRVLISEPNPERLMRAVQSDADRGVNPAQEDLAAVLGEYSNGRGADVVIVAAPSHQGQESALQLAAIQGRINFFGGLSKDRPSIQFDSNVVHYKELIVTATTACSTADCRQAAEIVNSGRIQLDDLISARFRLRDAVQAFAAAEDRKVLKVVLEPGACAHA